jgi:hypothetical protein
MNAIRIRKRIDSDTQHLPELRPLIGKTVEIIILDETADPEFKQLETEETFFGLAPPPPTPEEQAADFQKLRAGERRREVCRVARSPRTERLGR